MQAPIPWHLYAPDSPRGDGLSFFRCDACGFIWKDPAIRPTVEQERSHYRKHNNKLSDAGYRAHLMGLLAPVAALVEERSCGLDFGSGPAPSLEPLAREMGLDCNSFDPFFAPNEELLQDGRYDFVLCCEVVEHFREPRSEICKLARLLKPGGLLGIKTQMPPEDFSQWWYHRDPTHVSFFSEETFRCFRNLFNLTTVHRAGPVSIFRSSANC